MPYDANKSELEILKFWQEKNIFEKSVKERSENKPYVFYDGPPFATGLPHYGHIVASLMKDIVPRYWTMRGFRVERVWGWDCHGLPIENIIEEKLKLKSKKDIEKFGIDKFNEECRSAVLTYAEEWEKTIKRMGRWVNMDNAYKTMDLNYMESVWWVFKELWKNKLIYKGYKPMHICPRCVTPLSNFEVTQNYKEVRDLSAVVKFKVKNAKEKLGIDGDVYLLAWTTTPWTLPGNVLLAVNKNIVYSVVNKKTTETQEFIPGTMRNKGTFIVARDLEDKIFGLPFGARLENAITFGEPKPDSNLMALQRLGQFTGVELIGLEYEPLFPYFANTPNAFRVVAGDFVSTEEGTGIVHIAPAFGEDDYNVGKRENIPLVQHVTMEGKFVPEVKDFAGLEVKPKENPSATDEKIIDWLENEDKLFNKETVTHSYPFCWRCDTPLLNYSTTSWFVKVAGMKRQLLKNNEKINWVPGHIKEGRFGLWLEGARDWAISRNRYWGTPLPVWENSDGEVICVGSVAELEKLTGEKIKDLHKHKIDKLEIKKDGKVYRRIPEVLDCWFESGSMPYAQFHYPFENKKKFEDGFPAEFIAEGQDQTRGWFYTLHVLANALFEKPAFKNVIVNGIVLAEDGKKMSKRLKNYPEPDLIMEKYGADAMRYYFLTSPVMEAENLNFSETEVREAYNKTVNILWNVVVFYQTYANCHSHVGRNDSKNVLDRWIIAKLNLLVKEVTESMEKYELVKASRPIAGFIDELSTWWLRRSRERFKSDSVEEKSQALNTLYFVLNTLSKIIAPFMPFIAETIYQEINKAKKQESNIDSVHLEEWPKYDDKMIDEKVINDMVTVRKIVEIGLALRAESGIKVRQPLSELGIMNYELGIELKKIIADELNVKTVETQNFASVQNKNWKIKEDSGLKVALNIAITDELKKEGMVREIIRTINQMRKEKNFTINDIIIVEYSADDKLLNSVLEKFADEIKKAVLADELKPGKGEEVEINNLKLLLSINKA